MRHQESDPAECLRVAAELNADGQYQKALDTLEAIPATPEVLKAKAVSLVMLGQIDQAIACYEKVVKSRPDDGPALIALASLLTSEGRFQQAVAQYDRAIRLEPRAAALHRDRALALRFDGHGEDALKGYNEALQLDENDGDTWAAKADLLIEQHHFTEALECLEKASAAPTQTLNAIGWSIRGSSLAMEGADDEAIRCFDRALDQDPREGAAIFGKASLLERKGDIDGALACIEKMISAKPDDPDGFIEKARLLTNSSRFEDALESYKAASALDPRDKHVWSSSAYCRRQLGQFAEALADYDKAIDLDPGFALAWENKGLCFHALARHGEAVAAWRRALELDAGLMWPNNNIGWVLADVFKEPAEALQWYDRAIKLGPDEVTPVINKASALIELNRGSEAQALLEGMLTKAPSDEKPALLAALGSVYSENYKDAGKALQFYEQAVALGDTEPGTLLSVAELLVRLDRHKEARTKTAQILRENVELRLRTVAAFLLYASYAIEGDVKKADSCFTDFSARMVEFTNENDSQPVPVAWHYDGLLDTIVKSSASLAAKFTMLAAIDLQAGELVGPSVAKIRQSFPLIQTVEPPPQVANA